MRVPAELVVRTFDTDEKVAAGAFTLAESMPLGGVALYIYKHGPHGSDEKLRINIYIDSERNNLVGQTEWTRLDSIEDLGVRYAGWIPFEFAKPMQMMAGRAYYFEAEVAGYVNNDPTYYLSFALDWPIATYADDADARRTAKIELYGYFAEANA